MSGKVSDLPIRSKRALFRQKKLDRVGIYLIHDYLTRLNEPFRVCLLSTIQSLQAASAAVFTVFHRVARSMFT